MHRSLILFASLTAITLSTVPTWAAQITLVKGNKAAVYDPEETLNVDDEVLIVDEDLTEIGSGVIKKRQGKRILLILNDGEMKKGLNVVAKNAKSESPRKPANATDTPAFSIVGYGGIYNSEFKPTPIAFGGDIKYRLSENPIILRAGVTRWSTTSNSIAITALDFAAGAGWQINFNKHISIEPGIRLGYVDFKVAISAQGITVNSSATAITVTPYIGSLYHITPSFGLGAELRLAGYFASSETSIGDTYLLGQAYLAF